MSKTVSSLMLRPGKPLGWWKVILIYDDGTQLESNFQNKELAELFFDLITRRYSNAKVIE